MLYTLQTASGGIAHIDAASSSVGSAVMSLSWNVNRAPTNTRLVGTIPANARIIGIFVQNTVVSNAATTATVSVGLSGGSGTAFSAAQDIKAAVGNFSQAATASWAPATTSRDISCVYTETGTASTTGTATINVLYCVL